MSSGSIAAGMKRLGFSSRPTQVNELQAAAAVGQMELVGVYESHFEKAWFVYCANFAYP